eukprot:Hpha_TRINITY_DN16280_c1_g11::TRINITY_DN16280_c1_g11_i2::g.16257::m.16257
MQVEPRPGAEWRRLADRPAKCDSTVTGRTGAASRSGWSSISATTMTGNLPHHYDRQSWARLAAGAPAPTLTGSLKHTVCVTGAYYFHLSRSQERGGGGGCGRKMSPEWQQNLQSQFRCPGSDSRCATILAFPVGAPSVRCPVCQTVTPIENISVTCGHCGQGLVVPRNTTMAMCPRCQGVLQVSAPPSNSAPPDGGGVPPLLPMHGGGASGPGGGGRSGVSGGGIPKNPALAAAKGRTSVPRP